MPNAVRTSLILALVLLAGCVRGPRLTPSETFDVIVRGGVVIDGSGLPRYRADVGIVGDRIAAIGDLSIDRARVDIDATGHFVAPGFINLHSHANAGALPRAVNMLTQGVTSEILNPDGGGPLDIAQQLRALDAAGLAVNVGAYIGFNTVWSQVVGANDVRATPEQIGEMQRLLIENLEYGAWGVSAGLDYKPAYFARVEEVVRVLEPVRAWRTNFTNHDRLAPETGYSSRVGIGETLTIGERAGLVPVVTHMKVQGHEQGGAPAALAAMRRMSERGLYAAADVYPYLAGQTALASLIIPGWAQEGGRDAMLARFRDPELRPRIAAEADEAMRARFGGPEGVYLPVARRELTQIMREMRISSGGEAVIRILEESSPSAILRFGSESDLVAILKDPSASIACDCGASNSVTHPRGFGTYPRVLGRYVRETGALTWEDAIRKMTALPAATIGMVDRGYLAVGMAADIVVFDPSTIIDHATYEEPNAPSEGIRHVIVSGRVALRNGETTGARGGRALVRSPHMPSRPMGVAVNRRANARGTTGTFEVTFDVSQMAGDRQAWGSFTYRNSAAGVDASASELGVLQISGDWMTFSGRAALRPSGEQRSFLVIVDPEGPGAAPGSPLVHIEIEGLQPASGSLSPRR